MLGGEKCEKRKDIKIWDIEEKGLVLRKRGGGFSACFTEEVRCFYGVEVGEWGLCSWFR